MSIEPELVSCLEILRDVLDRHGIRRSLMGALVLQLYFGPSVRRTQDADFAIWVRSWQEFEQLKKELLDRGYGQGSEPHRLRFGRNAMVDLIPYHPSLLREGKLVWPDGTAEMNLIGYDRLFELAEPMEIAPGLDLPAAPLSVFVVLKMVCYEDSQRNRDLSDIFLCLEHYEEEPETSRRYQVIEREIDWDSAGAYILGKEAARFMSRELKEQVNAFLARFADIDAPEIDYMLREQGGRMIGDEARQQALRLLRAFERGLEEG